MYITSKPNCNKLQLFCEGQINDGDYFLYTDAWNPTVIQLKYMANHLRKILY